MLTKSIQYVILLRDICAKYKLKIVKMLINNKLYKILRVDKKVITRNKAMSMNEDTSIYKKIELLQEYILAECEAYIYNPQDTNHKIFLRIKHIVDNLCKNAFIMLKQNKTLFKGNAQNISLLHTHTLLMQIYNYCSKPYTPAQLDDEIDKLLNKWNIVDADINLDWCEMKGKKW